jgi:hypothetical protein
MTAVGWVDFSSDDRQRVQQVLALLKETGTLDELGVGQVRDAFSDLLFPGFSTIQTAARYFIAVPKILRDWSDKPPADRRKTSLERYLGGQEDELARILRDNHDAAGISREGIIGHTLVDRGGAQRLPSSTYWNGLRVFGIVRTSQSLGEFVRTWGKEAGDGQLRALTDDGDDDIDPQFEGRVRRPPGPRDSWPKGMVLALGRKEAEFLAERFRWAPGQSHSVTSQLLTAGLVNEALDETLVSFPAFSTWADRQSAISLKCREAIGAGAVFSLAIEGAHILYNRLLAKRCENATLLSKCDDLWPKWRSRAHHAKAFHSDALDTWLVGATALKTSIKPLTRDFLEKWNDAVCRNEPESKLSQLVERQAKDNKPGRSLLVRLPKAPSEWYGMLDLDYRWSNVRRMLQDVQEGLQC